MAANDDDLWLQVTHPHLPSQKASQASTGAGWSSLRRELVFVQLYGEAPPSDPVQQQTFTAADVDAGVGTPLSDSSHIALPLFLQSVCPLPLTSSVGALVMPADVRPINMPC